MIGLIKDLDLKYDCKIKCIHCDNAGKKSHWRRHANRKGLECFLSIQLLELHNRMEEWKGSLQ